MKQLKAEALHIPIYLLFFIGGQAGQNYPVLTDSDQVKYFLCIKI